MIESFVQALGAIPKELIVLLVAMVPIAELRGAIPLALYFGFSIKKAFILAVIGNAIPVIPILVLFKPFSERLRHFRLWRGFFDWLETRTLKKADTIQKYETLGLAIFVGIPLPMTGAWTGALAASLLKMKFRYALIGTLLGIIIAAVIVSSLCMLGMLSWEAIR